MAGRTNVVLALDVDGVLIDPNRGGQGHWLETVAPTFGITPEELSPFWRGAWGRVVNGEQPIEEAVSNFFSQREKQFDTEGFLAAWLTADLVLNELVMGAAERWNRAGIPIVLATNQEHRRASVLRQELGGRIDIADVLYSADLRASKPSHRFFERADARIAGHFENHRVVFVDDAPGNIDAARSFGWSAIHFRGAPEWQADVEAALTGD